MATKMCRWKLYSWVVVAALTVPLMLAPWLREGSIALILALAGYAIVIRPEALDPCPCARCADVSR